MPIFKYNETFLPILKTLKDKNEHDAKEIDEKIAKFFKLTENEKKEILPSGSQFIYKNRIGWGRTYLKKAGLIESKKRSKFNITNEGMELLSENPADVTLDTLNRYPSFLEFRNSTNDRSEEYNKKIISNKNELNQSPEEKFESAFSEIKNLLVSNILEEIKNKSPEFFEKWVIDLLLKMGYGGSRIDAGKAVGKVGDEGIYGIIDEDKLGLDKIYIQAKRYTKGPVSRSDLQRFVGALGGKGASKGVFITTSQFTQNAIDYVKEQGISSLALIDGEKLANLLIDYNVGVSTMTSYEIKQIDTDYFEMNDL